MAVVCFKSMVAGTVMLEVPKFSADKPMPGLWMLLTVQPPEVTSCFNCCTSLLLAQPIVVDFSIQYSLSPLGLTRLIKAGLTLLLISMQKYTRLLQYPTSQQKEFKQNSHSKCYLLYCDVIMTQFKFYNYHMKCSET